MSNQTDQSVEQLITDHIDIWSSSILAKSTSGRGSSNKYELYGIRKLRELIISLAVTGLLVPQDESDDPAIEILNQIRNRKLDLIKDKKIKKPKPLPDIEPNDIPYTIPEKWEWARLGNLGICSTGKTPKTSESSYFDGDIPFIGPGQITNASKIIQPDKTLTEAGLENSTKAIANDILMVCIGGSIGKSACVDRTVAFNQQINAISPLFIDHKYLLNALQSNSFLTRLLEASSGSATPIINRGKWELLLIPVPPLDEQKRIVAKVDELMQLCDQLEQQTESSIEAHATLVEVLLNTLTDSEDTDALKHNWARLADNFDIIFTTEQSIEALKQTILQLAVMGKLVSQNPDDEPASVLLESVEQDKQTLIKDKILKRTKPLPTINNDDIDFDLPKNWSYQRLGNLLKKLGSGSTPRGGQSAYVSEGIPFLRSQNVWNYGLSTDDIAFIDEDTHKRMSNTVVYPGDILLNITGASLGRCAIFPDTYDEANVNQHVTIIRLIEDEMTPYIYLCLKSPLLQSLVWDRQVGMAIEGLSKKVLELFEIPIPPLAEQKRIVAKVEELMDICDQLKEQLQQSQQTQVKLTDALVNQTLA